jgi:Na+/H+ antiporter NhaC
LEGWEVSSLEVEVGVETGLTDNQHAESDKVNGEQLFALVMLLLVLVVLPVLVLVLVLVLVFVLLLPAFITMGDHTAVAFAIVFGGHDSQRMAVRLQGGDGLSGRLPGSAAEVLIEGSARISTGHRKMLQWRANLKLLSVRFSSEFGLCVRYVCGEQR